MPSHPETSIAPRARLGVPAALASRAAAALAGAFVIALAIRPIAGYDIGYHLTYGQRFLDGEGIVQTNRFIYTRLDPKVLSNPDQVGPGSRFDPTTGTYYFVNPNWLSQVVMAAVHRAGDMVGLCILNAGLTGAMVGLMVLTMRRMGVAWHWCAAALLLVGLVSYERLNLRPETFAYVILLAQWLLLADGEFTWRRACGVIGLQVLLVNCHIYFILGVCLPGAMLLDGLLRWLWARTVAMTDASAQARRLKWLAVATGGAALACLVNPWLLRGAVFPVETMLYMQRHHILDWPPQPGRALHPWAFIGEFITPFAEGLAGLQATRAFRALLVLAVPAGLAALLLRRWGWLAVLAGMTVFACQARRDIAPGALLVAPLIAILLTGAWQRMLQALATRSPSAAEAPGPKPAAKDARSAPPPPWAGAMTAAAGVVSVLCIAGGAWLVGSVVTNRFYADEGRIWRFGLGASKSMLPLESAEWINSRRPAGTLFCDFADSSSLLLLTGREVPVLTNTFACPPYVMQQVMELTAGVRPFGPVAAEYGVEVVVLRYAQTIPPLIRDLACSPDWVVVHLGPKEIVFLRRNGPNADLARKDGFFQETFRVGEYIARVRASDPLPAEALYSAGRLLDFIGWTARAAEVWQACLDEDPDHAEALLALGSRLTTLGARRLEMGEALREGGVAPEADDAAGVAREYFRQAERRLVRLLELRPNDAKAREAMEVLRRYATAAATKPAATAPAASAATTRAGGGS